ncbi:transaldolase b [Chrysochromulina tobinii]|uniref:Transaldolase n=1 Tax=Chrysochromulina tobinii TaxID=1460289 RepID=A0A0M0KSS6_9EUKA|nr:transaldolase b [Chrysochromulina tobinii]|eukprot:KOO41879.1 transaldolase b [Chrysochromulina sp. CCMP291]
MHLSLSLSAVFSTGALLLGRAGVHTSRAGTPTAASIAVPEASQLAQLARMTTLSIDTGDLDIIKAYGATGLITDATTNPLFVSQAGLSGDARYIAFVDSAIAYAKKNAKGTEAVLELAMDRLAVELGLEIVKLVPGYVSTEVDIRASFDTEESIARARRIIAMYEAAGVPRTRVLVKLAGTWEGIQAAKVLEKEGITCNITLIFGFIQAVAAAQAGARLISPFPGRIKDWAGANGGKKAYEPSEDPGVKSVSRMYAYYKKFGHENTICMPASWRPSRSTPADKIAEHATDEIVALAGVDRMTIPPSILDQLAATQEPLLRQLTPAAASAACADSIVGDGDISEAEFRFALNADVCATTKMAEGINMFVAETLKLEAALRGKL